METFVRTSKLLLFFSAVPWDCGKADCKRKLTKHRRQIDFGEKTWLREGAPTNHDCLVQFSSVSLQQAPSGRE